MKTRTWVLLLGGLFLLLAGLTARQYLGAEPAAEAEIWVDGVLTATLELSEDRVLTVESREGWNQVTVRDGRVSVTAASCPDGDCLRCGAQNSGPPIVCLPNRVSIRFTDTAGVDGVVR